LEAIPAQPILAGATYAEYAGPRDGQPARLLFVRDGTLFTQTFDSGGSITGPAATVAPAIAASGTGRFSSSQNGVLAYAMDGANLREFAWADRTGKRLETVTKPIDLASNPSFGLSPDGKRLVVPVNAQVSPDLWIADLERKAMTRFTFDGSTSFAWAPDGKRLLYAPRDRRRLVKPVDGSGSEEVLFEANTRCATCFLYDWSPDGKWVTFTDRTDTTSFDVWLAPVAGDRKPVPFLQSRFGEVWARFSPDSRFVAYMSDESGTHEIYVRALPPGKGRWPISTNGGFFPRWRRDGTELYYREGQKMMAVPIRLTPNAVEPGAPRELFQAQDGGRFDVSPDGQRFLLHYPAEGQQDAQSITIVTNWQSTLSDATHP